jgi:hypothetical protein
MTPRLGTSRHDNCSELKPASLTVRSPHVSIDARHEGAFSAKGFNHLAASLINLAPRANRL